MLLPPPPPRQRISGYDGRPRRRALLLLHTPPREGTTNAGDHNTGGERIKMYALKHVCMYVLCIWPYVYVYMRVDVSVSSLDYIHANIHIYIYTYIHTYPNFSFLFSFDICWQLTMYFVEKESKNLNRLLVSIKLIYICKLILGHLLNFSLWHIQILHYSTRKRKSSSSWILLDLS